MAPTNKLTDTQHRLLLMICKGHIFGYSPQAAQGLIDKGLAARDHVGGLRPTRSGIDRAELLQIMARRGVGRGSRSWRAVK